MDMQQPFRTKTPTNANPRCSCGCGVSLTRLIFQAGKPLHPSSSGMWLLALSKGVEALLPAECPRAIEEARTICVVFDPLLRHPKTFRMTRPIVT